MPQLQCPNCQKPLHLPHDVTRAKLKCKHCEHVFVASTKPAGSEPASNAGQRPAAPAKKATIHRHPRNRRKPSTGAFVATILGATLLIVLAGVASYLYLYPSLQLEFDNGEVWFSGRISRSLRDAKIEEFRNLKSTRQAAVEQDQPIASANPTGQQPEQNPRRTPARNTQQNPSGRQPTQPPQPTGPDLTKDPKIRIEGIQQAGDTGDSRGHVVALLSNDYNVPIRRAVVQFYFFNQAGAYHALKPQTIQYVPPKTRIHISAPYNVAEKIDRIDYKLSEVDTEENLIVTMIPLNYDQQEQVLTGWVRYGGDRPIISPRMYVEFFDQDDARIHTAMLDTLEDAPGQLTTNKAFFLKAPIKNAMLLVPDRIEARLLGRPGGGF